MKHDVKLKRDLTEDQVEEYLDSGYNLVGFSTVVRQERNGSSIVALYVFSKEIEGGF